MDELINQITARTGIGREQAGQAIDTVKNFLKAKLPGPIASQVDGVLAQSGGTATGNAQQQAQQPMGKLGQMLHGDG